MGYRDQSKWYTELFKERKLLRRPLIRPFLDHRILRCLFFGQAKFLDAKLNRVFEIVIVNRVLSIFEWCEVRENEWRRQKVKNSFFFLPCIKLAPAREKGIQHSYIRIKVLILFITPFVKQVCHLFFHLRCDAFECHLGISRAFQPTTWKKNRKQN